MATAQTETAPNIVLLTDFGLSDPYVGQMKGVLRSLAPEAVLVDLSHGVPAYQVETGAFFLASAYRYFPQGAIFIAVVDPAVGTVERDILIMQGAGYTFVGPDNGILSLVLEDLAVTGAETPLWRVRADAAQRERCAAVTFAGRDIMAPLAARLCQGAAPHDLAEAIPVETLVRPIWAVPEHTDKGILASVLHVDNFGNAILNLSNKLWTDKLARGDVWLKIESAGAQAALQLNMISTYAEIPPGKVGLLPGGQGYLELAMYRASAAAELLLKTGSLVHMGHSG